MQERWEKRKDTRKRFQQPIERRWEQFKVENTSRRITCLQRYRDSVVAVVNHAKAPLSEERTGTPDSSSIEKEAGGFSKEDGSNDRVYHTPHLMIYDSLISLNDAVFRDSTTWIVKPRPDGKRALLCVSGMKISVIDRKGRIIWSCSSNAAKSNNAAVSLLPLGTCLDGIWCTNANRVGTPVFYILDVLQWHEMTVEGCEFCIREFFLRSRLEEIGLLSIDSQFEEIDDEPMILQSASCTMCSLCFINGIELCSADVVEHCSSYTKSGIVITKNLAPSSIFEVPQSHVPGAVLSIPFKMDGVLFFHSEASYTRGPSPFVVHWRPTELSEWGAAMNRNKHPVVLAAIRTPDRLVLKTQDQVLCHVMNTSNTEESTCWQENNSEVCVQVTQQCLHFKNDGSVDVIFCHLRQMKKHSEQWGHPDLLSKLVIHADKIYQDDLRGIKVEVACSIPSIHEAEIFRRSQLK